MIKLFSFTILQLKVLIWAVISFLISSEFASNLNVSCFFAMDTYSSFFFFKLEVIVISISCIALAQID